MEENQTLAARARRLYARLAAWTLPRAQAAYARLRAGVRVGGAEALAQGARANAYLQSRPPGRRRLLLVLWSGAALLGALVLYVLVLIPLTPGISDLRHARAAQASTLVSADGKELASFDQGLQEHVTLAQISPQVVAALVATEDHRFYQHHGVDFVRIGGALLSSLSGDAQGGSTITQQLARNMFPEEIGRSRNLNRKVKEMITALKIEATFSKTEILEAYLNTVPFLYNTFGIEMAARTYFDKPAARLDILESATLVGMLKGTHYYNPVGNPERSLKRRNVVLGQMRKHNAMTERRYRELVRRPLRVRFSRQTERSMTDAHFTAHVRKWLIEWADENDYNLERDGLVVHTTLDYALQQAAMRAVERQGGALQAVADTEWSRSATWSSTSTGSYAGTRDSAFQYFWDTHGALADAVVRESPEYRRAVEGGEAAADALRRLKADRAFVAQLRAAKTRLEAGFVAMDPGSGQLRAWVGSRDFRREQYDHVAQAQRQPGSTFKPFVYGAALEKGLPPEKPYRDAVLDIKAGDGTIWRPTDMSGTSGQQMTMRDGLVYSKNTITAQVMQDVGLPAIVKLARALGVRDSKLTPVPSLALGTSPVTLLEMVNAYASIAAQGEYRKPVFVTHITDRAGKTIASFAPQSSQRAMSAESAATLVDMMRGVVNRGTGTGVRYRFGISGDVAGKTGTTQNNTDGWFILMHPNLVAGAWVGFNDARVTMRSNYWGQGGHNALLVVGDFFRAALDGGRIERDAVFPGGRRPAPVRHQEQPQEVEEEPGDLQPEGAPEPGQGGAEAPPPEPPAPSEAARPEA
ncbi:penicillin-binding protein 1A [Janthinobacterium sp. CG_23.3]|uniref:penicillin-binding protein 1A n=1 Tax=Janthinobacterium sp. CG_23.3 TaxID=3349634 RepID=UPI0038D37334